MSNTQVGTCPQCGAPIYSPTVWGGITPPPVTHTCMCVPRQQPIITTGTSADELYRLRQQVTELEKDAERYRYCIDKGYLHPDYAPDGEYWDAAMEADDD